MFYPSHKSLENDTGTLGKSLQAQKTRLQEIKIPSVKFPVPCVLLSVGHDTETE